MKHWSQMPRMAPVVLVVALLTLSEALKLHGESEVKLLVKDMEGAANVAQAAYQQELISTNTWKALSNVSCFLEAAHSAGLDWTHSAAEKHIIFTAHGLRKSMESVDLLQSKSISNASFRPPLSGMLSKGKKGFDGLSKMVEDDDKAEFGGEALGATVGLLMNWAVTGEPPSVESIVTIGFDMITMGLGMFNPLLGAVAGMCFSIIGPLLFPDEEQESPMVKLYKKIMEEVGVAIKQEQMETEIHNVKSELGAVMDELQWMPAMLGGAGDGAVSKPSTDQARILLTYNIMIQHDIAKMAYKIQNSRFGAAEVSGATEQWAATMFPLARQLIMLQTNLLYDISAHELVQNTPAAAARILDLLSDWKTWIDANLGKAHEGNKRATQVNFLKWDGVIHEFYLCHSGTKMCRKEKAGGEKEIQGIDAFRTMQCPDFGTAFDCGDHPSGWCGDMCYWREAYDFYWRFLSPKVAKIQQDVEKMIAALGPLADFQKMGWGHCQPAWYASGIGVDPIRRNLADCADMCRNETKCKYFAFKKDEACFRYDSTAGSCPVVVTDLHELYKKKGGFEWMGNDKYCQHGFYAGWGDFPHAKDAKLSLDNCAAQCRSEPQCRYFAFQEGGTCSRYDSRAGSCPMLSIGNHVLYRKEVAPSPYQSTGTGYCSNGAGVHGHQLVGTGLGQKGFDTPEYKGWVERAWAHCLKYDAATTHVSLWKHGHFRCYRGCPSLTAGNDMKTWTYEKSTPVPMKSVGQGQCNAADKFYDSQDSWVLTDKDAGDKAEKGFDSEEYKAWVQQAWQLCVAKDPNTTFVTVWNDAGYECYNGKNCHPVDKVRARSWTKEV